VRERFMNHDFAVIGPFRLWAYEVDEINKFRMGKGDFPYLRQMEGKQQVLVIQKSAKREKPRVSE
jgi:hypothetical protein